MSFENLEERLRRIEEALSLPVKHHQQTIQSHSQYGTTSEKTNRSMQRQSATVRNRKKCSQLAKCSLCGLKYKDQRYLRQHMQVHKRRSKIFECSTCRSRFKDEQALKLHTTVHETENKDTHKSVSSQCSVCGLKFKNTHYLEQHMIVHNAKPYKCHKCEKQFSLRFILNEHLWQCHSKAAVKPESSSSISCRFCLFKARTYAGLTKHVNFEHWSEYLSSKCSKCGFEFTSKQELDSHAVVEHSESEVKYECVACTFSASTWPNFLAHIKRHYFEDFIKCATCEKTFNSKLALREHVKKHNIETVDVGDSLKKQTSNQNDDVEPVEWRTLVKKMVDSSAFKGDGKVADRRTSANTEIILGRKRRRKRIEDGDGSDGTLTNMQNMTIGYHSCSICNKIFRREQNLVKHNMDRHLIVQNFECAICGSKYTRKHDLRLHLNEHFEPFTCKKCSYRCAKKMQLRWHVFRHHNDSFNSDDRVLTCAMCNYETTARYSFVKHTRAHLNPGLKGNELGDHNYSQRPSMAVDKLSSPSSASVNWVRIAENGLPNPTFTLPPDELTSEAAAAVTNEKSSTVRECMLCDYKTNGDLRFKRHMKTHIVEVIRSNNDHNKSDSENAKKRVINGKVLLRCTEDSRISSWSIENIEDIRMDESESTVENAEQETSGKFHFIKFSKQITEVEIV